MRAILGFLLLIIAGPELLLAQQVLDLDIEAKIDPVARRLAGTLRIQVLEIESPVIITVPEGIEVDKVLVNAHQIAYRQQPGKITFQLESSDQPHSIRVIFYGMIPAGSVSVDEDGFPWITLVDAGQDWKPGIPRSWRLPDSVSTAIILDRPLKAIATGAVISTSSWPGNSIRWNLKQPAGYPAPAIYIGQYVHFSNRQQHGSQVVDWTYWVPASRVEQAQEQYARLPAMVSMFSRLWGRSALLNSRTWIEPPGPPEPTGRSVYPQLPPGYSDALLQKVAESWLGDITLQEFSPVRRSFFQYASILWVQEQFAEDIFLRFLESHRHQSDHWGGWLLYHLIGDAPLPRELFIMLRQSSVTDEELRIWLSDHLHPDFQGIARQYFDIQVIPVLELRLIKRRSRWELGYKWSEAHPDFSWPVELIHRETRVKLLPESDWKQIIWPKGDGKSYHIDESQGLFDLKDRS